MPQAWSSTPPSRGRAPPRPGARLLARAHAGGMRMRARAGVRAGGMQARACVPVCVRVWGCRGCGARGHTHAGMQGLARASACAAVHGCRSLRAAPPSSELCAEPLEPLPEGSAGQGERCTWVSSRAQSYRAKGQNCMAGRAPARSAACTHAHTHLAWLPSRASSPSFSCVFPACGAWQSALVAPFVHGLPIALPRPPSPHLLALLALLLAVHVHGRGLDERDAQHGCCRPARRGTRVRGRLAAALRPPEELARQAQQGWQADVLCAQVAANKVISAAQVATGARSE